MGGKRRNRQPDANMHEAIENSSDSSGGESNSAHRCHALNTCLALMKTNCHEKMTFDTECAACKRLVCDEAASNEQASASVDLWICLGCSNQACGREQKSHALEHYKTASKDVHCMAANTQTWNIWCYNCDRDVTGIYDGPLLDYIENLKEKALLGALQRPIALPYPRMKDDKEKVDNNKSNSGDGCPHAAKAFAQSRVTSWYKKPALDTECAACKRLGCNETPAEEDEFSPAPLWICLFCSNQACGREQKGHALEHHKAVTQSAKHCLVANTQQWNIWCYVCDKDVTAYSSRPLCKLIEILKKKSFASMPVRQQPIALPFSQMNDNNDKVDEEKSLSPLNDLTRVVGLTNLGNTCFFNAVLQCLSQTPFLVKVLEDMQESGEKFVLPGGKCKSSDDSEEVELPPIEGTLEGRCAFTSILCKTLKTMQIMKTRQTFSPNELLASFKKKTMQCMDGGQHDSHELLRHLLELVRNEDLRRYHTVILRENGVGTSIQPDSADDMCKAHLKFYGRQACARLLGPEPVFRGVFVSTLECLECHHTSQRTEPFLDLSLPVMADKPQPPVLKRKIKGFDDSFDFMGNSVTSPSSMKNNFKKEDKAHPELSRKQMRKRMQANYSTGEGNCNGPTSNTKRISEEKQSGNHESESDGDIEDNVSPPEIVESGYSSEKVSALTSPVSPSDHEITKNSLNQCDLNVTLENGNLPLSPHEISTDSPRLDDVDYSTNNETNGQTNPANVTINLNELATDTSDSNWPESPMIEATNNGEFVGDSSSTSFFVNLELSPDEPTTNSRNSRLSSEALRQRRLSPPSGSTDDTRSCLLEQINGLRLIMENSPKKFEHADTEVTDNQTIEDQEDQSTTSPVELAEVKTENGVADIIVELSNVTVSPSTRSHRYHTKEGDCSIQSCLNQFTALELMCGSNKVGCEACTARENKGIAASTKMVCTQSTKQYLISSVPAVLILHLKRFQSLRMGFRKVAKHVPFPLILDLAPVCKGVKNPKVYSLYGVVEHSGTLHGGHYVAYVKTRPPLTPDDPRWAFLPSKDSKDSAENSSASSSDSEADEAKFSNNVKPPPGNWYYVSDSRVMEVDEAAVLQSQAYILFYERLL